MDRRLLSVFWVRGLKDYPRRFRIVSSRLCQKHLPNWGRHVSDTLVAKFFVLRKVSFHSSALANLEEGLPFVLASLLLFLKDNRVQHGPQALDNVGRHEIRNTVFQVSFGVHLPHVLHQDFFRGFAFLLLDPFIVILGEFQHFLHQFFGGLLMGFKAIDCEARSPIAFMQVHQHLFFQFVLTIINDNRIIMSVEAMNQSLNRRFLQMTNIGRGLSWLLSQHHQLGIDQAKAINHHLAFDGLDGIHHESDSSRVECLKRRLCVNVGT
mmetsp:Transcript_24751/g.57698  ORF Transcript_24751/g.57698 Transcript_24751/m.57698 type:complete len:266 (-) Transcript_24751:471-1268(-)